MQRLVGYINRLAEVAAVVAFATLITVVSAAVFWRYVLNDSVVWAEELSRYCFIWVTFLGGGLGVGKNIHVGVDSLVMLLPQQPRKIVEVGVEIAIVIFLITLIAVGVQFMQFGMNSRALMLQIPMGYVYAAVPAGALVMLANVLLNLQRHVREVLKGEAS